MEAITQNATGFDFKRQVGDLIEYDGKEWVIIKITGIQVSYPNTAKIKATFVTQQVGKEYDDSSYYEYQTFTGKDKQYNTGHVIRLKDYKNGTQRIGEIVGIERVRFEFTEMVTDYIVRAIKPWTPKQMNEAVRAARRKNLRLI